MSTYGGDGEPVERWDEDTRRSKRDRKCRACHQTIERGQLYHRSAMLFDGSWQVIDRCARCEAMFRILSPLMDSEDYCDGYLNCGHTWRENFGEEPPIEVQALAFLTPGEAQVLLEKGMGFGWARFRLGLQGPPEREDALMRRLLRRFLPASEVAHA